MWYCKDRRVSVEPLRCTLKTQGVSRATMWYCKDARVPEEPLCDTVKTRG